MINTTFTLISRLLPLAFSLWGESKRWWFIVVLCFSFPDAAVNVTAATTFLTSSFYTHTHHLSLTHQNKSLKHYFEAEMTSQQAKCCPHMNTHTPDGVSITSRSLHWLTLIWSSLSLTLTLTETQPVHAKRSDSCYGDLDVVVASTIPCHLTKTYCQLSSLDTTWFSQTDKIDKT